MFTARDIALIAIGVGLLVVLCSILVAAGVQRLPTVAVTKLNSTHYGNVGETKTYVVPLRTHRTSARVRFGSGQEVVLLVGSCPVDQRMWDPVLSSLSDIENAPPLSRRSGRGDSEPTVITYDSMGCGTADSPSDGGGGGGGNAYTSMEDYSRDIDDLLAFLNIGTRRLAVGGWGFGGLIAQHYSLTRPTRVASLLVFHCAPPTAGSNAVLQSLIARLEQYRSRYPEITYLTLDESVVREIRRDWFAVRSPGRGVASKSSSGGEDSGETNDDIAEIVDDMLRETEVDCFLATLRLMASAYDDWLVVEWSKPEPVPFRVYVMSSDSDQYATPHGTMSLYTLMRQRARGRLVLDVKQSGLHAYALTHPDETAREILGAL